VVNITASVQLPRGSILFIKDMFNLHTHTRSSIAPRL